jgi:hypothetical protein
VSIKSLFMIYEWARKTTLFIFGKSYQPILKLENEAIACTSKAHFAQMLD